MIRHSLFILFISFLFCQPSRAQVQLHDRTWDYTMSIVRKVDSLSCHIEKNKLRFKGRVSKLKAYSPETRSIHLKRKVSYKRGHIYVNEIYIIGIHGTVKVLRMDGQIVMVKADFIKDGAGSRIKTSFSNLGDHSWQWIYRTYDDGRLVLKSGTLYQWH